MGAPLRWVFSIVPAKWLPGLMLWAGLAGCTHHEQFHRAVQVSAEVETVPVPSRDDAADDPAIWIDAVEPARSLVIGTDKGSGLLAYDLSGAQLQYLPVGELNNVDLRQAPWGQQGQTLLAATQRNPSRLVLFVLDHASRELRTVASHTTELAEPYGICMYQAEQQPYLIANSKGGEFVQYAVTPDFALQPLRRWRTRSQPEGCVADDLTHTLYFGEEAAGVWQISALPDAATEAQVFDAVENGRLVADVEGMTLYRQSQRTLLIVSSQGDNSFVVYDTATRRHLLTFQVADGQDRNGDAIDGATETDGIAATALPLPGFPGGLLVVQDGYNRQPASEQNFKLVDLAPVIGRLD
ncbi:MAG: phytase [Pseudomonadota bacterium]